MSQIGSPQKNILEPIAGGYPATVPVAAGESSLTKGQLLVDNANQRTGGRDSSDLLKIPKPDRVSAFQPDLPVPNGNTKTIVANGAKDANGNRIVDSDAVFSAGTTGGPYDIAQSARLRALNARGQVELATVAAAPRTSGYGAGYGAFSGGSPAGASSDGYGTTANSQLSLAAINRSGSRNHAMLNVIHRPGDNQAVFLF